MAAAAASLGVPVLLLREAEGHAITIELKSGELYRGTLGAAESTMNVQLQGVIHTGRDGRVTKCVLLTTHPHTRLGSISRK